MTSQPSSIRSPSTTLPPVHHLPPPNLPPTAPSATFPPPPRVTELPSILSSPRNNASASPAYSQQSLPPTNSLPNDSVLPPMPYNEHRSSATQQASEYRPLNVKDALSYLDVVKIRFSNQPEVYNQFLDIMKDFKSQAIDTPGVIERVSSLFRGNPTLISGFNTFLPPGYHIENDPHTDLISVTTPNGVTIHDPESNNHHYPPPPPPHSVVVQQPNYQQQQQQQQQPYHSPSSEKRSPLEFNHAISYVNRIKNRFVNEPDVYRQFLEVLQTYQKDQKPIQEVYSTVQYLFQGAPDLLDEFKQFLPDISGQTLLFDSISSPGYKRNIMESNTTIPAGKKKRTNNTLKKNKYDYTFDPVRPSISTEEIELFERIRKHIGNKPSYEEFLKTLNLYTQQIFDLDTLVEQVKIFIGNNKELYDCFKSVVGYEPKEHAIERPPLHVPKPDLAHCKATTESPSYRIVPQNWSTQPCSGRDQLAWEVLNDEYVSHPIWASEDDGFVASKKNQYEETMHRCEEERYDYNMNIEANLNVIALLEPIYLRIEKMTPEEKANFRLEPGLGGQTVSIYERIIKKVYDKERGNEIIELLYSNPATVVPILLKRLKQKDEEWKKAQSEWNKVWRDTDAKNYYKALDYQGITFKSNDRKVIAPKSLVSEIESMHKVGKHFNFSFQNPEVFKDVTRVVYSYMDHQSGYSSSDREKIRTFLQHFIPLFFHVDNVVPEGLQFNDNEDEEMEEVEENNSVHTSESESETDQSQNKRSQSPSRRRNGKNKNDENTMDLLREALTKSDETVDSLMNEVTGDDEKKLLEAAAVAIAPTIKKRGLSSFFCNTLFYCFFRQYEMLYQRLSKLRAIDDEKKQNSEMGNQVNKVARDLGLYTDRFNDVDFSSGSYNALLDIIDRFFYGDIDQQTFEEQSRYLFVTDAYLIFTIDKLVQSMIKQIQSIIVDTKSVQLIRLFRSTNRAGSVPTRAIVTYQLEAEEHIESNENLYRINYDNESKVMKIQFINEEYLAQEPMAEDKYEEYVASYMDWIHTTDSIDTSKMKPTFLTRSLRPQDEHLNKIFVRSKLQYKIDQNSYHMYYIVGSEDVFVRPNENTSTGTNERWNQWLESSTTGWSKGLGEETKASMEQEARKLLSNSDA